MLAAIAARGWADDVDVVFTTDHGELQGDFGLLFKGPYHVDGLMRLPLIWRPAPSAGVAPAVGHRPGRARRPGPDVLRRSPASPPPTGWRARPLPVDDADADGPRLRAGAHRVGQRAVRRRRAPAHDHPRRLGVHHLPARHRARRHRGRALRPGRRPAPAGQPLGRPGGRAPMRDDLLADLRAHLRPAPVRRASRSTPRCERRATGPARGPPRTAGPRRLQVPAARHPGSAARGRAGACRSRTGTSPGTTMVVLRDPGEVYVLRHGFGDDAPCLGRADRPGHARGAGASRPTCPAARCGRAGWPPTPTARCTSCSATTPTGWRPTSGAGVSASCPARGRTTASSSLPDGHLVTKDFGGSPSRARPTTPTGAARAARARPERRWPIVARLDAARAVDRPPVGRRRRHLRGGRHQPAPRALGRHVAARSTTASSAPYRTLDGPDLRLGRGDRAGRRLVPRRRRGHRALQRHVPRDGDLRPRRCTSCGSTWPPAAVTLTEVCGLPGGLVANPPARRRRSRHRGRAIDSGNGVVTAFDIARRRLAHRAVAARARPRQPPAAVPGHRRARHRRPRPRAHGRPDRGRSTSPPATSWPVPTPAARCSPSLFPAAGFDGDVYLCSMATLTRICAEPEV